MKDMDQYFKHRRHDLGKKYLKNVRKPIGPSSVNLLLFVLYQFSWIPWIFVSTEIQFSSNHENWKSHIYMKSQYIENMNFPNNYYFHMTLCYILKIL